MKTKPIPNFTDDQIKRFNEKIDFSGSCWNWKGSVKNKYGHFKTVLGSFKPHRVAYTLFYHKNISAGMTIDHLCRNKLCVNPAHLEVVTLIENVLRGNAPSAINLRKTECIRGHSFSGDNVVFLKTGGRRCRTCFNYMQRRLAQRKRLEKI